MKTMMNSSCIHNDDSYLCEACKLDKADRKLAVLPLHSPLVVVVVQRNLAEGNRQLVAVACNHLAVVHIQPADNRRLAAVACNHQLDIQPAVAAVVDKRAPLAAASVVS